MLVLVNLGRGMREYSPTFKTQETMNKTISLFCYFCLSLTAQAEKQNYDFVVAADGSGDYTTIQAAINAVPDYRKAGPTRILVHKAQYLWREQGHQRLWQYLYLQPRLPG